MLVPEAMLLELKGKLPKSPEFQATIGLGHQLDHIQGREDLNPEEKVALYGHQLHRNVIGIIYNKPVIKERRGHLQHHYLEQKKIKRQSKMMGLLLMLLLTQVPQNQKNR